MILSNIILQYYNLTSNLRTFLLPFNTRVRHKHRAMDAELRSEMFEEGLLAKDFVLSCFFLYHTTNIPYAHNIYAL